MQRIRTEIAVSLAAVVGLLALTALAVTSPIGAALAVCVAVGVLGISVLGVEKLSFVLIVGGAALAPMNGIRPVPGLSFATASDLLLLAGIGLLAVILIQRDVALEPLFVAAAGALTIAALITALISDSTFSNLNIVVRLVIGALAIPVVFMLWRPGIDVARWIAMAYLFGNAVNVAYAQIGGPVSFEGRRIGWATHPNILGVCSLLALALVPLLLRFAPRTWRIPILLLSVLAAYGLWISGSRAAIGAAVLVGLLWPLLSRSVYAALAVFAGGCAGVYVLGQVILTGDVDGADTLGRFFGGGSASASDLARDLAAQRAWDQFHSNPIFGSGFSEVLEAHNIYLQMMAAGGVVALAAYLLLHFAVVRRSFLLGAHYYVIALPVLAYILIGPMTTLMWDRYIWIILALPFLIPRESDAESQESAIEPVEEKR